MVIINHGIDNRSIVSIRALKFNLQESMGMGYSQMQFQLNDCGQKVIVSQPTLAETMLLYKVILESINYSRQVKVATRQHYMLNPDEENSN